MADFVLAGHSHSWSMGAPLGYQGPRGLVPGEAFGRFGFHLMEEDGGSRTEAYWNELVAAAPGRDVLIVWNGNQHWQFMFRQQPSFDFFDRLTPALDPASTILPSRMIEAFFEPTIEPLGVLLDRLRAAGAHAVTTIGTPPPPRDMDPYIGLIRGSAFFRMVADQQGVDLEAVDITPTPVLLKLWRVIQRMVARTTEDAGGRFVPVPATLLDHDGYLAESYQIAHDFTHADAPFGLAMLKLALHPEEPPVGAPV